MRVYLFPELIPPLSGRQAVTVEQDAVRFVNAMSTENADVVEERELFSGVVREPDEMHYVRHHVQ